MKLNWRGLKKRIAKKRFHIIVDNARRFLNTNQWEFIDAPELLYYVKKEDRNYYFGVFITVYVDSSDEEEIQEIVNAVDHEVNNLRAPDNKIPIKGRSKIYIEEDRIKYLNH